MIKIYAIVKLYAVCSTIPYGYHTIYKGVYVGGNHDN